MNPSQRRIYFTQLWPAAASKLGCKRSDNEARHAATREAMRAVKGPATDSIRDLGAAEVTALFAYLRHLANPDNLRTLSAWMSCQEDYKAFNQTRQADWWRAKAGYKPRGRLERDRFGNRPHDGLFDEARMSPEESRQYLMTMRARAKAKTAAREEDPF